MAREVRIGSQPLEIEDVLDVASANAVVVLDAAAARNVRESRESIERILGSGKPVYGVTTGVGRLASVRLGPGQIDLLQSNILMSHAAGTGALLPVPTVRAAMLLRAASLSRGYSGVKPETLDLLIALLNADIIPEVPSQGSVGSSGDLAPLSHIALALLGQGTCVCRGRKQPTALAMSLAGLEPIVLGAKEGLALINGTQIMCAILVGAVARAQRLVRLADIAGALSLEAVHGISDAFDSRLHALRPHAGQQTSAANIRALISNSSLVGSDPDRIQDAYSLRCMPVVHGAARDALTHVTHVLKTEMNAITDNPSIFADGDDVISGGNFHGEPIALVADYLGIAMAELGNISERRTNRLLDGSYDHLPMFLVKVPGTNSGLMIPQYTAAALASENKGLAHPNAVDTITTSANQEDHNSMGTIAARTAAEIGKNVETILSIELMTAAQALEFSTNNSPGTGTHAAFQSIRKHIAPWEDDRYMYPVMEQARKLAGTDQLLNAVDDVGVVLS